MIFVFAGLFFEFSSMVGSAGKTIEKYHNCTFYSLDNDTDSLSQCTETITGSLKSYLYLNSDLDLQFKENTKFPNV